MKLRTITLGLLFALMSLPSLTQAKSWQEELYGIREKVRSGKVEGKTPIFSAVKRYGDNAQTLEYDLTGVEKFTIVVDGTADGNGWDHAVYANPRLTTASGEVVALGDLKYIRKATPKGYPLYDRNGEGKNLSIGDKEYERGLLIHANSQVEYELGGKYVKFEAEVGIDNGAQEEGSAYFKVEDSSFDEQKLYSLFSAENLSQFKDFASLAEESAEMLLFSLEGEAERRAIVNNIPDFKSGDVINKRLAELDKLPRKERMEQAVKFIYDMAKVKQLNDKLQWIKEEPITLYLADMKGKEGFDYPKNKALSEALLAKLPEVKGALENADVAFIAEGEALIEEYGQIMKANPLLDVDRIVVTKFNLGAKARTAMAQAMGATSTNYRSMMNSARRGCDAEIAELTNLRGDIKIRTIYKPEGGENISDLQMHWDANRLLFSSVDEDDRWRVYEVNNDGSNFHQKVTLEDKDIEYSDANYLPDGRIVLTSTIGYNGVPCVHGSDIVNNLSLYNPEDGSFRRLAFDQDGNWSPTVKNDGKVMYTRWEYTDLTHYFSRIVMHMNPDGTECRALYGSGSFFPTSTFDMKPLPGSDSRFVGVISGHHGIARSGRLIIFDPNISRKEEHGMVQEMPFKDRPIIPIIKDQMVAGVWPQFIRPQPISDDYFLVSAKLSPTSLWGIYLVDVHDNLTCIAEFEGEAINSPLLVKETTVPPVIPDRVDLNDKEATIFIQDIYEGEGTEDLPRGVVKELRVFAYEYAYWNSPSNHDGMGIQAGWDIKRLLGTVPVEEDGSAIFKVPANTPISIQPIDSEGRALQWMRSWFTPQPGEVVSCIGCHEDLSQFPIPKLVIASRIKPRELTAPEGGVRPFTFDLEIQPILDRACIACHDDSHKINFKHSIDSNYPGANTNPVGREHRYSSSYLKFMNYFYRQGSEADMYVMEPYEYHANNSEMVRMLKNGHHGVELTDKEWRTLYNWIDFNAPDRGVFGRISEQNGYDQYTRRIELANKYNNGAGVDWKKEIEDYTAYLESKGEIKAVKPEPQAAPIYKERSAKNFPLTAEQAQALQAKSGKTTKRVEIAEGIFVDFVWVPAGTFVMGDNKSNFARPESKAKVSDGFWMSTTEITNEQFCAIVPSHDSRVIGQFWKDHTTAGYWANLPQQPVIRVSLDDAKSYAATLSSKLGMKVGLPTETEWEWACRGGSDSDFWFGDLDSDFSEYDNMADETLSQMAVKGLNPKPMSANDPLRKYWDFLPKVTTSNDGEMISANVGQYKPNPWGLIDMHGNVAEWTTSSYGKEDADLGVVRGGSWMDRPKYATSYVRKGYYPWQRIYNVGFRLIIKE